MERARFRDTVAARGELRDLGNFTVPGVGTRRVRVFLPRDYVRGEAHPALYMFDGQNVFDDAGSFAGGWHLHTAVDKLARARKRAPVTVGIEHGGTERLHELSPFAFGASRGEADRLLDWLVSALMPEMARRFHLLPGAVGNAVGGSSLGGLAALYAHYRHPEALGGALCMSPSLWVAGAKIHAYLATRPRPAVSRVYLDGGAREGRGMMTTLLTRTNEILAARGYPPGQLMYRSDPRGRHDERSWRRRAPRALRFLYA